MDLKKYIADVKDFPEQGIIFRDISPLMANGEAYRYSIKEIVKYAQDLNVDKVVGPEARGFMVGCPVAVELGCGFAMARKKGKLPFTTVSENYALEYGEACVEIHTDAVKPGDRVLLVDDLVATGGTMLAGVELIRKLGGDVVEAAAILEFTDLPGGRNLRGKGVPLFTLFQNDGTMPSEI